MKHTTPTGWLLGPLPCCFCWQPLYLGRCTAQQRPLWLRALRRLKRLQAQGVQWHPRRPAFITSCPA